MAECARETGVLTVLEMRPIVYSPTDDPTTGNLSIYVGEGVSGPRVHTQPYSLPSAVGWIAT